MGKNNRQVKIGEDKVLKKLYKAKTKWVIQGGIFGALILGTAFGVQTSTTYAAENGHDATAQTAKTDLPAQSNVTTLSTSAPKTAPVTDPASTTETAVPVSTTEATPAPSTTPVATETADVPETGTTPASAPAADTAPATNATSTTKPATKAVPTSESIPATPATSKEQVTPPPVGTPKSGLDATSQPVQAAPITLNEADAKNQFTSMSPIKDFDSTGTIQQIGRAHV